MEYFYVSIVCYLINLLSQCAIVLKTPPYIDKAIQTPVTVSLQLKRGKDNECSPPIPFTYKPLEYGKYST